MGGQADFLFRFAFLAQSRILSEVCVCRIDCSHDSSVPTLIWVIFQCQYAVMGMESLPVRPPLQSKDPECSSHVHSAVEGEAVRLNGDIITDRRDKRAPWPFTKIFRPNPTAYMLISVPIRTMRSAALTFTTLPAAAHIPKLKCPRHSLILAYGYKIGQVS